MKFKFNVYGTGTELGYLHKTVNYKGKFPPDELPDILDGNLGLIWDGSYNDEDEAYCLKNYTKYNNPHKLSLYILCWSSRCSMEKICNCRFYTKI